jgi:hypothetical protein
MKGLSEANQVLLLHEDYASTRTVNVRYEKERDAQDERQNHKANDSRFRAAHSIADQQIGADSHCCHK